MPSPQSDRAPLPLRKILELDIKLTNNVVTYAYSKYPQLGAQSWKSFMTLLEISCHGVPWIAISLISMYMVKSTHNISVNLLLALVYDIAIVATLKAITRRPRPIPFRSTSPLSLTIGPDKLSFPSGHATRAILLTFLFNEVTGSTLLTILLSIWSCMICTSRVIMRRHHVLDVCAGVGIGVVEWVVVSYIWVGESGTSWIGKFFGGAEDEMVGL